MRWSGKESVVPLSLVNICKDGVIPIGLVNICKNDVIGLVNIFDVPILVNMCKDGMAPIALMWIVFVISDVHFVRARQNVVILATT